jgi:hypothetical protein
MCSFPNGFIHYIIDHLIELLEKPQKTREDIIDMKKIQHKVRDILVKIETAIGKTMQYNVDST